MTEIPYAAWSPVVDGSVDEWPRDAFLAFDDSQVPASDRNQILVALTWDKSGIFAAFRVQDRHVVALPYDQMPTPTWFEGDAETGHLAFPADSLTMLFVNDSIELHLTARTDNAAHTSEFDYQFIVDAAGRSAVLRGDPTLSLIAPSWKQP